MIKVHIILARKVLIVAPEVRLEGSDSDMDCKFSPDSLAFSLSF
jgi:hypothetical protein